jgi:hypothetical protein
MIRPFTIFFYCRALIFQYHCLRAYEVRLLPDRVAPFFEINLRAAINRKQHDPKLNCRYKSSPSLLPHTDALKLSALPHIRKR